MIAAGLGAAGAWAETDQDLGLTGGGAAIHQEVVFKAAPARVYHALTDTHEFDRLVILSGAIPAMNLQNAPTRISDEVGGAFALFGGYITGRHLELEPGVRIIQAWRAGSWAPHVYSIARFELTADPGGTRLVFDHTGFPGSEGGSLARGWREHYWAPLAKVLA
jgi:uncharacterized protein YndB with AHSA1/START domain